MGSWDCRRLEKPAVSRYVRVGTGGKVETARPSLPAVHLRNADLDPSFARVTVSGRVDPANPFPTRHGRNAFPENLDLLRASVRAVFRSWGTVGSGQSWLGSMSRVTVSPALTPAARWSFPSTLTQWPPEPSGSSTVWNTWLLIVPWAATCPREGNCSLAFAGNRRIVHLSIACSVASQWIVDVP